MQTFQEIIQRVDTINNESSSDEAKLYRAGDLLILGSSIILDKAQKCLEHELHPGIELAEEDTAIDESFKLFLNSWTQQNVSTNFLTQYLMPHGIRSLLETNKTAMPQPKAKYEREANLTPVIVVEHDCLQLETKEWEFSYDENIEQWTKRIDEVLKKTEFQQADWTCLGKAIAPQLQTLSNIVKITGLTQTQVFISLLMMELNLNSTGDFYDSEILISNF